MNIKAKIGKWIWDQLVREVGRDRLLSLLDENTEGVSDDPTESGVLHGVRESLANDRTDTGSQSSVDGTLEKITDDENEDFHLCPYCKHKSYLINDHFTHMELCHRTVE